jgi:hypothetical protein
MKDTSLHARFQVYLLVNSGFRRGDGNSEPHRGNSLGDCSLDCSPGYAADCLRGCSVSCLPDNSAGHPPACSPGCSARYSTGRFPGCPQGSSRDSPAGRSPRCCPDSSRDCSPSYRENRLRGGSFNCWSDCGTRSGSGVSRRLATGGEDLRPSACIGGCSRPCSVLGSRCPGRV